MSDRDELLRAFIAVDPSEEALTAIGEVQRRLKKAVRDAGAGWKASFPPPERLHLTQSALSHQLRASGPNTAGIGARIAVYTDQGMQLREVRTGTSFQAQNDLRQHFGLAQATQADVLVRWPDGTAQRYPAVAANHIYTITKEQKKITVE